MNLGFLASPEWLVADGLSACIQTGTLCVQRCTSCGLWRHPPRRFCASCRSAGSAFEAAAGTGAVRSFAVSHRSLDPTWQALAPFVTLVVELDEGPRILAATRLLPGDIAVDDRVDLSLEVAESGAALVWARPAAS